MSSAVQQHDAHPLRTLFGHRDTISSIMYLPDGQRLVTGSHDKTIRIWRVGDGRQEGGEMTHAARVCRLAVTSDGKMIVSSDENGRMTIWNAETHELVEEWQHNDRSPKVAISRDNRLVAYGFRTVVVIRELSSRRVKHEIKPANWVFSLCFSPDGTKLACGMIDDISIHDVEHGTPIGILTLKGHVSEVGSLQWSGDGTKLYSASYKDIRCWNLETGEQIGRSWMGHTNWIRSLSLSLDGRRVVSGGSDQTVRVWDDSGHPIGEPLVHKGRVFAVSISPSNNCVAVAGEESIVSIWRIPSRNDENQPRAPSVPSDIVASNSPLGLHAEHVTGTKSDHSTYAASLQVRSTLPDRPELRSFPEPPDLTSQIVKLDDRYREAGGFSDVHLCEYHSPLGIKQVAVKSFRFVFLIEEGTRSSKMLHRELGIWKRLEHPNIVPFLGIADGFGMQGSKSLVSLWMQNGSLHKFIASHDEDLHVVHRLQLLLDVANGLEYLHSFLDGPIVHGDLNGNNVLLDADFTACLADFGYSSFMGSLPEGMSYLERSTARPGATRWIAPEQLEDTYERTPKSDIYSFGCISLQMLSGKKPWSEVREDAAVILRLGRGQRPDRPVSRAIDDIHWEFIQRCWASVEDRPTASTLVSLLQEFLGNCPHSPSLRDIFASSS